MATWRPVSKSSLENEKNGPGVLPKLKVPVSSDLA
jgi:hypothetical protein